MGTGGATASTSGCDRHAMTPATTAASSPNTSSTRKPGRPGSNRGPFSCSTVLSRSAIAPPGPSHSGSTAISSSGPSRSPSPATADGPLAISDRAVPRPAPRGSPKEGGGLTALPRPRSDRPLTTRPVCSVPILDVASRKAAAPTPSVTPSTSAMPLRLALEALMAEGHTRDDPATAAAPADCAAADDDVGRDGATTNGPMPAGAVPEGAIPASAIPGCATGAGLTAAGLTAAAGAGAVVLEPSRGRGLGCERRRGL
jgi:hypothetical protein